MAEPKLIWDGETREAFGMLLPLLTELGYGWFLAMHPNGIAMPNGIAICTKTSITVLHAESAASAGEGPPESVRAKAVEWVERRAGEFMRPTYWKDEADG